MTGRNDLMKKRRAERTGRKDGKKGREEMTGSADAPAHAAQHRVFDVLYFRRFSPTRLEHLTTSMFMLYVSCPDWSRVRIFRP
jgi:hypothetical protein